MPKPTKITLKQRLTKDTKDSKPSIFDRLPNGTQRRCPLCYEPFTTDLAYQTHVRKHPPQCPYCDVKLNHWNEFNKHMASCSRKYGCITVTRPILAEPYQRPVATPFECCLCKKRYAKHEQMIAHQIERCPKRYLTAAWIVKI